MRRDFYIHLDIDSSELQCAIRAFSLSRGLLKSTRFSVTATNYWPFKWCCAECSLSCARFWTPPWRLCTCILAPYIIHLLTPLSRYGPYRSQETLPVIMSGSQRLRRRVRLRSSTASSSAKIPIIEVVSVVYLRPTTWTPTRRYQFWPVCYVCFGLFPLESVYEYSTCSHAFLPAKRSRCCLKCGTSVFPSSLFIDLVLPLQ